MGACNIGQVLALAKAVGAITMSTPHNAEGLAPMLCGAALSDCHRQPCRTILEQRCSSTVPSPPPEGCIQAATAGLSGTPQTGPAGLSRGPAHSSAAAAQAPSIEQILQAHNAGVTHGSHDLLVLAMSTPGPRWAPPAALLAKLKLGGAATSL